MQETTSGNFGKMQQMFVYRKKDPNNYLSFAIFVTFTLIFFLWWISRVSVVVTSVDTNSLAAASGLKVGDKLLQINNTYVSDAQKAAEVIRGINNAQIDLVVSRNGQKSLISIAKENADLGITLQNESWLQNLIPGPSIFPKISLQYFDFSKGGTYFVTTQGGYYALLQEQTGNTMFISSAPQELDQLVGKPLLVDGLVVGGRKPLCVKDRECSTNFDALTVELTSIRAIEK